MLPSLPIHRLDTLRALEAEGASFSPPLMERAGEAAARLALSILGDAKGPVLVLCGPGNNGGDGLVMAHHLLAHHIDTRVVFIAAPDKLPADARAAFEAFIKAGGVTLPALPNDNFSLAVDALFGIGLSRPIDGIYAEWIAAFNALPCPRLALDIPSGLDAETGATPGPAVRATHTLTFIAAKPGLLTNDGPDVCGEIHVDNLGLDATKSAGVINGPEVFGTHLKPRARNTHKGSFGNVGIVGGARGMAGAALIAARAALKLGAGRVFVGLLDDTIPHLDPLQPELMLREAASVLPLADVLAIGPGLGQSREALAILRDAIASDKPLVLDADALNLLAAHRTLKLALEKRAAPVILTPHPAEAARLLGQTTVEVQSSRLDATLRAAREWHALVVLKGCGSVIAEPEGRWWINPTGNPGMASAGMGDALSGLIVALLAQRWPALAALQSAAWLHGASADACVRAGLGPNGLTASDVIETARGELNRLIASRGAP